MKPLDETILEHTIGYEQLAVDLTADMAQKEPNSFVKAQLDFALVEDFDHLYRYADLLDNSDHVICLNDSFKKGCMHQRNRYIVDRSSLLISAFNGTKGGTEFTVNYAKKQGLRIVNVLTFISEEDFQLSFE